MPSWIDNCFQLSAEERQVIRQSLLQSVGVKVNPAAAIQIADNLSKWELNGKFLTVGGVEVMDADGRSKTFIIYGCPQRSKRFLGTGHGPMIDAENPILVGNMQCLSYEDVESRTTSFLFQAFSDGFALIFWDTGLNLTALVAGQYGYSTPTAGYIEGEGVYK